MKGFTGRALRLFSSASFFALLAGTATLPPGPALAQDATASGDTGTETVVVTARLRAEQERNVPIAMTVISADDLSQMYGSTLSPDDILQSVPGLHFDSLATERSDQIEIRGSGASATNTTADDGVGLYHNGMYVGTGAIFTKNYQPLDTFDLERVEVLRGTQSALYGRDAVGGVINFIAYEPEFDDYRIVDANYAVNIQGFTGEAIFNQQLDDHLAVRVSGQVVDQTGGFFKDLTYDKTVDGGYSFIGRGQIRYQDGPLDVNFMVEGQALRGFNGNNELDYPPGSSGFPGGFVESRGAFYSNVFPVNIQSVEGGILTVHYQSDIGTFTSVTGYRQVTNYDLTDRDQFDPTELAYLHSIGEATTVKDANQWLVNAGNGTTLYEDAYIAGNKIFGIGWLAGLELLDANTYNFQDTEVTVPAFAMTLLHAYGSYRSYSPFVSFNYDILSNLNLEAETRYSNDNKTLRQYQNAYTAPLTPYSNAKLNANNLAYNVTLTYHWNDDLMFYAKTGSAYRAGGFNNPSMSPNPSLDPMPVVPAFGDEVTYSNEIGAKGNPFVDWLYVEAALYRNVITDVITQVNNGCLLNAPPCFFTPSNFLENTGRGDQWGLELTTNTKFALFGGEVALTASGTDELGKFVEGPFKGYIIPQEPLWMAQTNLNYTHQFLGDSVFFFNVDYNAQWGGMQDTQYGLPDRQVVDARMGVDVGNWEGAIYSRDLNDAQWSDRIQPTANYWSPLRVWGFEARYRW